MPHITFTLRIKQLATIKQSRYQILSPLLVGLLLAANVSAQPGKPAQRAGGGTISGIIMSQSNEPLIGISVSLEDTPLGIATDTQGRFELKDVPAGKYTLKATGIGYSATKENVVVQATKTTKLNLQLNEVTNSLNEVVVTGTVNLLADNESEYVSKMPLKKLENPQVYTSINKELLTQQLVFSVDDAIRNAPGVQKMWEATGRSGDGGSYYNTRGFIVQSSLKNGIAGAVTSAVDAINLEKLEVIKGPSATLFGNTLTSYGGLLNRVTKKPFEKFGAELSYSAGNFGFNRISADLNTPVDKSKELLLRLNTAFNYENSFQDRGFERNFSAAPSLSYKPTDRLSILLDAELFYGSNVGKQIYFFYFPTADLGATRPDQLNVDYSKSYIGDGLSQRYRSTNFFGQLNYKLSETFTSSTNFTLSNSFSDGFSPYFYFVPDNMVTNNPADAGKSNYIARADQSTGNSKNQVFEIQQNFNSDFRIGALRNRIVLGLDFFRVNSNQNFFGSSFDVVPVNAPNFDYSTFNGTSLATKYLSGPPDFTYPIVNQTNTYSAFVSNVLNISNKLSVLAALRADRFENKGGTIGAFIPAYNQTAFSPKFGIVFQPVKDKISLFANYQNSFNNQGTYTIYDITAPDSVKQAIAELENANQIETGLKFDVFDGKLSATVSYYNIRVKDILRTDPNPEAAVRFAQVQDGTQLSKGFEFEMAANPLRGMNVVAGFSYNDSKLDKADADVNGRRPSTASSPYLANLWLSYRLPENSIRGLGLGFGGNYASENKIINSASQGVFTLPAYAILNASVFYEFKKYRFSAKMDNLTNQKYWIGYTTVNPQKPRSFAASLAFKFR